MRAPLRSLLAVAIVLASAVGGAAYADAATPGKNQIAAADSMVTGTVT